MGKAKTVFTGVLEVVRDPDDGRYTLQLTERRTGQQGRLITCEEIGPFGISKESLEVWLVVLTELIDHATTTVIALDLRDRL